MERSYTILFDNSRRFPARHPARLPFDPHAAMPSPLLSEPPEPEMHRERLNAQDLQELAAEPGFVAAAEVMCTRLCPPLPEPDVAAGLRTIRGTRRRQSWGIEAVGAHESKYSGADVTVAVLDTGIDSRHAAFRDVGIVEKDFTGRGNGDADGHGTHSAGVIFGRNVEGVRIGVAPGVRRALVGKIIGPEGGDSDMLLRGIGWAHAEGAHVISLAVGLDFAATVRRRMQEGWSGPLATEVTLEAYSANLKLIDRLLQMLRMREPFTGGALLVAAAGNDSRRSGSGEYVMTACPPCGSDKVVSVGAFDPLARSERYRVSDFSNCGVDLTAPGRLIVSAAAGGGLRAQSGTGAAAPHVAGVAALWWQAARQSDLPATATLVRGKLLAGAQANGFSPAVYPAERGAGRVMAPRDSQAVAPQRSALRGRGDRAEAVRLVLGGALPAGIGAGGKPISLEAEFEQPGTSRSGSLC
jgi:subtilisin family serine protease